MTEQTKTVYQTNSDGSYVGEIILVAKTSETGEISGNIDPLETKNAGHIVWQIPGGCVEVEPPVVPEDKILYWRDNAWVLEDKPPEPEPESEPEPTTEEKLNSLTNAVQSYLDQKVNERGYDNILSACSYANSNDQTFQAEGVACVNWRDAVWRSFYNVLNEITVGLREIPTSEELLAELPELVWPET